MYYNILISLNYGTFSHERITHAGVQNSKKSFRFHGTMVKSDYFLVVGKNVSHTILLLYIALLQVSGSKEQTMSRSCKAEVCI
jgi:hypothetical protein